MEAMGVFGSSKIYIDDSPMISPMEVLARARKLKRTEGELGLIVVDYLQLMSLGTKTENRQMEVAMLTRSLKVIARELSVPIMVLSQLRRVGDSREGKPPQLSDLRESGSIEQDADVVIFLHREDYFVKVPPSLFKRSNRSCSIPVAAST